MSEIREITDMQRPATISECLARPMLCDCGREYCRGDFWAKSPLVCECGRRISYRCPWCSCEHHIALNRTWVHEERCGKPGHATRRQPPVIADVALVSAFCRLEIATSEGCHTLAEIGRQDATSRERIRQLEAKALGKLRAAFEAMGITADDAREYLRDMIGSRMPGTTTTRERRAPTQKGCSVAEVRAMIIPPPVRHPEEPAQQLARDTVALPLPPSLAQHRERLESHPRRRRKH